MRSGRPIHRSSGGTSNGGPPDTRLELTSMEVPLGLGAPPAAGMAERVAVRQHWWYQ